jgi:hypothetical protein
MIMIPIQRGLVLAFFGMGGVYRLLWTLFPGSVVRPPEERPFFCALPGPALALALVAMAEG